MVEFGLSFVAVPQFFHAGQSRTSGVFPLSMFKATAPPRDEPTITSGWPLAGDVPREVLTEPTPNAAGQLIPIEVPLHHSFRRAGDRRHEGFAAHRRHVRPATDDGAFESTCPAAPRR
jgi:hypothetical protein